MDTVIATPDTLGLFTTAELDSPLRTRIADVLDGAPEQLGDRLWTLQAQEPDRLIVYYLLYKWHAARHEYLAAERAALSGLARAGEACGLPTDVSYTKPKVAADFNDAGPARFWLLTLSALAFIWSRSQRTAQAKLVREWIARCDPYGSLGTDALALMESAPGVD